MNFSNIDKLNLQNYLRLKFLLLNYGNKVLQNLVLKRNTAPSGEFINALQIGSTSANTKNLPSTSMAKNPVGGSIDQWDFTLLASVILEMNANSSTAHSTIANENQHIMTLRKLRNDLEHTPAVCIPEHSFKHFWSAALNALAALGGSPEEIEHIRTTAKLGGLEFDTADIINTDSTLKAKYLRREGKIAMKAEHREVSIKYYSQALLLSGISETLRGQLYGNRCEAYVRLMEQDNASADEITSYETLALADGENAYYDRPDCWKNWYRMARVYKVVKNWKYAVECLDSALDLNPDLEHVTILKEEREECVLNYYGTSASVELNSHINLSLAEALNKIGQEFLKGKDVNETSQKMTQYLELMEEVACGSRSSDERELACNFIAGVYRRGVDVLHNPEKVVTFSEVAAAAGHPGAIWRLGLMYWSGEGVPQDRDCAVELWETAASIPRTPSIGLKSQGLGIARAMYCLALCHATGIRAEENMPYAALLLSMSSIQGCFWASRSLAGFYRTGKGVERNHDIAIQYLKLAVEQGCTGSLMDLCLTYLTQCKPNQAEIWFSRALDAENPDAILWKNKIEKRLKFLKTTLSKPGPSPPSVDHTPVPDPDEIPIKYQNLHTAQDEIWIQNENLQWPFPTDDLSKFSDVFEEIRMIPSKISGGYLETLLQYMQSFEEGFGELGCLESSDDNSEHKIVRASVLKKFAHCLELQETLPALPQDLQNRLFEIAEDVFAVTNDSSEETKCNARMCYVHLIKNSEKAITFIEESRRLYPSKPYFYQMHSNLLHARQKFSEGLRVVEEGLKLFPDNYELLFHRAVHSRMCFFENDISLKHMISKPADHNPELPRGIEGSDISSRKQKCDLVFDAYEEFIAKAPSDHWKISEAYYFIGNLLRTIFEFERSLAYYERGLDAEIQSSCLQQDTLGRQLAELLLHRTDSDSKRSNAIKQRFQELKSSRVRYAWAKSCHPLLQFPNPKRVSIVFHHRENIKFSPPGATRQIIDPIDPEENTKPSLTQKAPVLTDNLQEIIFDDMDPIVDCFYEKFFIDLVIMEDSLFEIELPIHSVVKDKNGEFQRLFIYNVDKKDSSVRNGLSFGSRIRIHNPSLFIKTSLDGIGLRVDDPNSLIFISPGDKDSLCRFCGQESAKHYCDECKRVKYCDSKCQKQDEDVLCHSFICVKDVTECHVPETTSDSFDGLAQ